MAWYDRFLRPQPKQLAEPEQRTIIVNSSAQGVSGTEKHAGIYTEDYFRTLQGTRKADEYDKMRRGDARVKMCLSAVKNPIRSANWSWQAAGDDEDQKKHAAFLNFIFDEDIGFDGQIKKKKELLTEATSVADFGFAVFERVHKTVLAHPEFGPYIGLKALGWRSPKTLEYFKTDENGTLTGIEQWAEGDIRKRATMDAKWLSIITLEKEGDNYEGVSLLRPCYGAWSRKQLELKLKAIGNERLAINTPKAKVPAGKENSPEYENMKDLLGKLTSHQLNYVMIPEGWDVEYLTSNFDPEKLIKSIQFENEEMTFAFLANFLMLGSGGNAGAYALSADLSKFFTRSILYIAELIAEAMNDVGKELIILNFGPQPKYPTMKAQGITDEIGTEFANMLKTLTDSKHITPDDNVEEELRRRMKLMPMREEDKGKRDKAPEPIVPPADPNNPNPDPDDEEDLDEDPGDKKKPQLTDKNLNYWRLKDSKPTWARRLLLAESKAQKKIGEAQDSTREIMKKHLGAMGADLVSKIMKNYSAASDSQKDSAINDVKAKGLAEYRNELKMHLVAIASGSIEDARKEVPKAKKVRLKEFESLPREIQKRILGQSRLLVTTTNADLEKVVFLQFGDSFVSTDSAALIEQDLLEAVDTVVNGASVSASGGNAASRVVNEARNAFFFDEEVLQEVDSFTFMNGDPVAPICQELAGQTMSKNDVEAQRLFPPLHHNCKSYLSVNLTGDKDNPPITGFKTKHEPSL